MRHIGAYLLIGGAIGAYVGIKYGKARARLMRQWHDIKRTRAQLGELFSGLFQQWRLAVKFGLVIAVLAFAGLCLIVFG